jgi:hypothetical protein
LFVQQFNLHFTEFARTHLEIIATFVSRILPYIFTFSFHLAFKSYSRRKIYGHLSLHRMLFCHMLVPNY